MATHSTLNRLHPAITTLAAMFGVAALAVSCDNGNDNPPHQATLYNMVELTAHDNTGTTFTLYRADSDEAATLRSPIPVDTAGTKIGESLFLAYIPDNPKPYASSDIEVIYTTPMTNRPLKQADSDGLANWNADPVYLLSIWRGGTKIYVRARLTYDTAPRFYELIVDEATKSQPVPDAYLLHHRTGSDPSFDRQYYVAFDISHLWNNPDYTSLRVHVNNSNNPAASTFLFSKER